MMLKPFFAIREALTSGVLIVTPAFPVLTATAVAKQQNVSTRQMPFQAAALILIFTPVDILRQQGFSFTFDPSGSNRPLSRTTRVPTVNKTQQNAEGVPPSGSLVEMSVLSRSLDDWHHAFWSRWTVAQCVMGAVQWCLHLSIKSPTDFQQLQILKMFRLWG